MDLAMRLDKYLSNMSVGTRSEVKDIIKAKRVTVNSKTVTKADFKVSSDDEVLLDGNPITYEEYEYYILNKPSGYITANEDRFEKTVMELVHSKRKDLSPVGRLDKDTEGLLLITNDGQLNHRLLSPSRHVPKIYFVKTDGPLPENAKEILESPMDLGDFTTKPALFKKISADASFLTISEGKFHQVKRMYEKIGLKVTYLKRTGFAFLTLEGLNTGEYRKLTQEEIYQLKAL